MMASTRLCLTITGKRYDIGSKIDYIEAFDGLEDESIKTISRTCYLPNCGISSMINCPEAIAGHAIPNG